MHSEVGGAAIDGLAAASADELRTGMRYDVSAVGQVKLQSDHPRNGQLFLSASARAATSSGRPAGGISDTVEDGHREQFFV